MQGLGGVQGKQLRYQSKSSNSIIIGNMSTDEYNRKLEESKKMITSLKKDLKYREGQESRGETTYSIDAEIRGSFGELAAIVEKLEQIFNNFRANPKDFGLSNKQIEKRGQQLNAITTERTNLQRQYDSYFQKKSRTDLLGEASPAERNKPDYTQMTAKQLAELKAKQQEQQEEAVGDLINVVRNIKHGQKGIGQELSEQEKALDELEGGMDANVENMGRVRRNMMKLLDESSNCCLIITIILEIVAIVCIAVLWK